MRCPSNKLKRAKGQRSLNHLPIEHHPFSHHDSSLLVYAAFSSRVDLSQDPLSTRVYVCLRTETFLLSGCPGSATDASQTERAANWGPRRYTALGICRVLGETGTEKHLFLQLEICFTDDARLQAMRRSLITASSDNTCVGCASSTQWLGKG
jgi:hypothetical protein